MRFLWDFIIIISLLPWIVGLAAQGAIPIQLAGFALVSLIFFRALGRGCGGNISRLIRTTFLIGIPIASLLTFAVVFGGGSWQDIISILGNMGVLFIMLIGFFIMFFGLFSSKRHK